MPSFDRRIVTPSVSVAADRLSATSANKQPLYARNVDAYYGRVHDAHIVAGPGRRLRTLATPNARRYLDHIAPTLTYIKVDA